MMIWMGWFFLSPSSQSMELFYFINDYISLFLMMVILLVLLSLLESVLSSNLNLYYFEDHSLEIIWTMVPFILLIFIALPSLFSLYYMDSCSFCGFTFKVMGHQWYWSYSMGDFLGSSFDSYMQQSESYARLLEVDNHLLVPCGTPIRFLVSSADVIHSWTIPSAAAKADAVPGRVNQICLSMVKCGKFFGQCSEICGANHSFMPIVLESVSSVDFVKTMM